MGFFSSIGEALFGTETKKQGRELAASAAKGTTAVGTQAKAMGAEAAKMGAGYDVGTQQSMGKNAADYMQKANVAAQGQAEQSARTAATQGTQAALQAARSSGLSKGQAALASGQQAGNIYTGAYQQGLESGRNQYQGATQQFAGQGAQMAGRAQNALNTQLGAATGQANIGQQQIANANQTASNTWGTIGTIAGAAATMSDERAKDDVEEVGEKKSSFDINSLKSMLEKPSSNISAGAKIGTAYKANKEEVPSDENAKKDIFQSARETLDNFDVMDIAKKVRPVRFKYKEEVYNSPGEKVGVIAQDLEKTPLASVVHENDQGLKMIDTSELSPAILNLVIQLARKVDKLEGAK